ncbi:MAG: DMT family transporter [Treponema sp.]|jgi:drug/metabolite transporter (DMT)-like permease|nr:DMT family transporter [Treponema sp.]
MNKKAFRSDLLLLLTAFLWGFGFVAQRSGMRYVGPFTFNGVRFLLGSLSLAPILFFRKRNGRVEDHANTAGAYIRSCLIAGTILFFAVTIQQIGVMFTTAGNAGFITGLYVALVPILGAFLGRKTGVFTWIGAFLTVPGMYLISAASLDSVNIGDVITLASVFFWAVHVLLIDRLVRRNDPLRLSIGQFTVCGVLCLIFTFALEPRLNGIMARMLPDLLEKEAFTWKILPVLIANIGSAAARADMRSLSNILIPILYGGLLSVGVAYTLQVVAQKNAPPAHATIILCLEGSFAALGGILILHEQLRRWTLPGFALMLAGMLVSQWEVIREKRGGAF